MYLFENELTKNRTMIHRKVIVPATGGGEKAYVDYQARPFCDLANDDMIDTADLCKIFRCSGRTVYRWINDHKLRPVRKAGREYLFTKYNVVSWYSDHFPRPGRPPLGGQG
jgi:excisionase family DNA binding protein